ncbi:Murein hydrolase activator NlpD precursor [Corynebacterium capitovis DSM 44611]|uniref:M23 family metallopeptidase n=1 Tax=Corynebacterium capitovis TaxID=131081 RepID=UPI00036BA371|nr:M23 family metallopeptidase [Corynebacterium capitovis]WKD58050.1 Murein hydrolase activator NlpD precursor [Corynebacterium capitovis DSM 44611]
MVNRVAGGRHRKHSPNKGRAALVAVATGAVTTAGVSAAAEQPVDYELTSNDVAEAAPSAETTPQILAIPEYKPVDNLTEQLNKAVEHSSVVAALDEAARAPLSIKPADGTFTSGFGARWGAMHNGIDIANAIGTPIRAVADGIVIDSGPAQGFGQWIRIRHDDGSVSVYGHMETLNVAVGQHVTAGQQIAGMGSQGFSTGSHLHFEIHPDGTNPVDPVPWLAARGITL